MRRLVYLVLIFALAAGVSLAGCSTRRNDDPAVKNSTTFAVATIDDVVTSAVASEKSEVNTSSNLKILVFSPNDAKAAGIELDMEKSDIEKKLGTPMKIEKQYEEAFGGDVLFYYYDFGMVRLEPADEDKYAVSSIYINKPGAQGPRGIKAGDSLQSVLSKFPSNEGAALDKEGDRLLYGSKSADTGFLSYDKSGKVNTVTFVSGEGGFGSYLFKLEIMEDKVKSMEVSVMNL
jgi:outer membrane protein assembly factor BamE (lipoprotein component of BamABCDE complex)